MNSTSTRRLWLTDPPDAYASFERDDAGATVDVAIVGGGITGLTCALLLAREGKRVVLLEARTLGSGTTSGTTAHLTEAIDTRYHTLESKFGREAAALVASSSHDAISEIASVVRAHRIDCDFSHVPGFLYSERIDDRGELDEEFAAAVRAGVRVSRPDVVPLPFRVHGALRFDGQAQLHPMRYIRGLARAAAGLGARIHEHSRVLSVEDEEPCVLHLENGAKLHAHAVFFATHAPLNRVLLQTKIAHYRSYAMAFPNPGIDAALFWDTEDPYHYTRSAEVDGASFLIIGGADHKTGESGEHEQAHFESLFEYARARFGVGLPAYHWSSQVIEPVDGLPFIGRNSSSQHLFVATGFTGNGMTFGTVAAMLIRDLVVGRRNPWADLYEATRVKPLASAGAFVGENIDFPAHLISDRLRPAEASAVSDVGRDEGKVVRVKGERLAVYRDVGGALHALSPVCTHLGCFVKFNDAERTWDCPCHGSRFDVDGQVLNGPATHALARRDIDEEPEDFAASRTAAS